MQRDINLSPDEIVYFTWGFAELSATFVFTWVVMAILVVIALLATHNLTPGPALSRWQNGMEIVVDAIRQQVRDITQQETDVYLPFLGSLFLFIVLSNFLDIVPGFTAPTSSIYTAGALALCVFFAVPYFGMRKKGFTGYMKRYISPTPFMLPFNIISDLSRTLSLAVRLFGNIMSGTLIVAILVSVIPLLFPVVMQALGLIIGFIQAYIFTVLGAVYIGSATRETLGEEQEKDAERGNKKENKQEVDRNEQRRPSGGK